jgi:carbon-monoxide dehydrogenase small subunit
VPSRDEIREHLSGNYCRCTGYHAIVDAVESTAKAREAATMTQTREDAR